MEQISPRQRRHQKTKAAILHTAQTLISEKGVQGLSLREIARRIDYSPAGLYEYFKSKDEIIEAVCAEGFAQLNQYVTHISADLPPLERLIQLGLAYLDFARNNPEHYMLIFTTLSEEKVSLNEINKPGSTYHVLVEAVKAAIDAGEFTIPGEYSLTEIAYILWAHVHGIAMLQQTQFRNSPHDFSTIHRWSLELFLKGLQTNHQT
ncbi:MAG: TetR/AcrR family transcriptional regulator [Chloroflexota bacterium]